MARCHNHACVVTKKFNKERNMQPPVLSSCSLRTTAAVPSLWGDLLICPVLLCTLLICHILDGICLFTTFYNDFLLICPFPSFTDLLIFLTPKFIVKGPDYPCGKLVVILAG